MNIVQATTSATSAMISLGSRAIAIALVFCLSDTIAMASDDSRPASDWLNQSLIETKQQKAWEASHAEDSTLLLGAGQYLIWLYGRIPDATFVAGTRDFIVWWQDHGAAGMEHWASDGFPLLTDRDHLIYSSLALYSALATPRSNPIIYINGTPFAKPDRFWGYYDRITSQGMGVYFKALSGGKLSQVEYDLLRIYAIVCYTLMDAVPWPPFDGLRHGLSAQYYDTLPLPGTPAPDFTLPTLESILKSPSYSDDYSFDYQRPFHSEVAAFLLYICSGFGAVPVQERIPGGPLIRAMPLLVADQDHVSFSGSRGNKPAVLVFGDGIDGDCASIEPLLEPLYQATKNRIDWHFVSTDLIDSVYWSEYYLPTNKGVLPFQKALTMEERARNSKMWSMRWPNITFPMLIDDMSQHTQIAYTDTGGNGKVYLIDRKGTVAMNSRRKPVPTDYIFQDYSPNNIRFAFNVKDHCVISKNIEALLNNDGLWSGKEALLPDWQQAASLENVTISAIDAHSGTITVTGTNAKTCTLVVDAGTRIVFANAPGMFKTPRDLAVGAIISCTYDAEYWVVERTARLIVMGVGLTDFISLSQGRPIGPWCPVIATGVSERMVTGTLVPRSRVELRGLRFWEQAHAAIPTWEALTVKNWADHPNQQFTFHLDRASEIILNGMKAKASDIQVGDHLGVEFRAEQKPDDLRPFFIFVYRYASAAATDH